MAGNPTLKGQEFAIDQAKAQKSQALSKLLPQVSAVGDQSYNQITQLTQLSITQPAHNVTTFYRGRRGVAQAQQALIDLPSLLRFIGAGHAVIQSELELEAARMTMTGELLERYFNVLEAQDELSSIEGEKQHTEGQIKRLRRMRESETATVTDLYEVESYYQKLLTDEIDIRNSRLVALEKLRELSGIPIDEVAPLAKDRLPDVPGEMDRWVAEAIRDHPALRALQYGIDSAHKNVQGAQAEHLPKMSLNLSEIHSENGSYDMRISTPYTVGTVDLRLNVPIYSGGGTEASVRESVAHYHMVLEKREEKYRQIERETRTAYLEARTGRARIGSTGKEIAFREKARDAQQKSYEYGTATIITVLESKKNLLKARFEEAKARYDYIRSLVALHLWAGNLSLSYVEEINGWLVASRLITGHGRRL
jgi:outer membrane protein